MSKNKSSQTVAIRTCTVMNSKPLSQIPGSLIPHYSAKVRYRIVKDTATKLPTGQYLEAEVFIPAWNQEEAMLPPGIYNHHLDGNRIFPKFMQ